MEPVIAGVIWRAITSCFGRTLVAITAAAFAGASIPAIAQTPAHAQAPPGLPIWVVRDDDSTIYITGTVHILRDDMQWRSEKLDAALASASELRLELAEVAEEDGLAKGIRALAPKYGAYDGPPVSSLLTDKERASLVDELKADGAPDDTLAWIDTHQPWIARQILGRSYIAGDAFKFENGIDNVLARWAVAHGVPVKGMETLEVQVALSSSGTFEQQLNALRAMLTPSPAQQKLNGRIIDLAFGSWLRGETNMAEALVMFAHLGDGFTGASTDPMLKDRNEHWAAEIEDMLKGSGVIFIAVGAGHLVGPDSLQARLKLRGLTAERY